MHEPRSKNASAFLNYGEQVESKMTKYEIIKQEIKEQIKDNILKPNQVIKSENEMCQCYKVSRLTASHR